MTVGDFSPIVTPSVINSDQAPEARLPWKFTMKDENGEDTKNVRFFLIPDADEPPAPIVLPDPKDELTEALIPPEEPKPPKEKKKMECCKLPKCCEIPELSKTKKLNWCFLTMLTLACACSGMQIGGALFNDAPLMHIISQ